MSDSDEKVSDLESKSNQAPPKSNQAAPKSNQAEPKSNQVRLTAKQRKVLEFCDETPRTAQEILEMIEFKERDDLAKGRLFLCYFFLCFSTW